MDIEEFYAQDERRRRSAEVELGTDWYDRAGARYELSWVVDTGELYVMREPGMPLETDPFGDVFPAHLIGSAMPVTDLTVAVVGHVDDQTRLEQALEGWQDEMGKPGGIEWLAERLRSEGIDRGPTGI
ncbi:MAG TPA: hypothetical protein VE991_04760 [Acidimicrobiales bacterium]|nr:hypothetical protein [Acidimicrobiales bacterium]